MKAGGHRHSLCMWSVECPFSACAPKQHTSSNSSSINHPVRLPKTKNVRWRRESVRLNTRSEVSIVLSVGRPGVINEERQQANSEVSYGLSPNGHFYFLSVMICHHKICSV